MATKASFFPLYFMFLETYDRTADRVLLDLSIALVKFLFLETYDRTADRVLLDLSIALVKFLFLETYKSTQDRVRRDLSIALVTENKASADLNPYIIFHYFS
jgi:hypothetical protein